MPSAAVGLTVPGEGRAPPVRARMRTSCSWRAATEPARAPGMPPPVSGDWLRHPLPRIRPRRRRGPDHSGAVGSSRRHHDHDLHACVEPGRTGRAESAGWHAGAARPWPKCSGLTAVCGFHLAMPIRASRAGCRVCETGTWLPSHGFCGIDGGSSDVRVARRVARRHASAGTGRTVYCLLGDGIQ
jgi:hypothetical protein